MLLNVTDRTGPPCPPPQGEAGPDQGSPNQHPMTAAGPEPTDATRAPRTPSVIVLGADALLAALPATPVQLAHACLEAGYQQVVPASWGDELVAQAALTQLGEPRPGPAIQCSCPLVAHRLLASGSDLRPFLVSVVSPAVAVARYLRAVYGGSGVRITYAGRCPGAVHDDIDARITPQDLLAELAAHGISLAEQPRVFDSIVPPDRRRFFSQPGGVPSPEQLWSAGGQRTLVELGNGDVASELAELLLSGRNVLVDPSTRLGCFCTGASEGASAGEARARIVALEPPRSTSAVVRPTAGLELDLPLPETPSQPSEIALPLPRTRESAPASAAQGEGEGRPAAPPRRRSPSHGIPRPVLGASPVTRDHDGRQLPRTYVARRRSTPRPFRVQIDVSGEGVTISETEMTTAVATPPGGAMAEPALEDTGLREREVQLLVTPRDTNGDAIVADQAEEAAPPAAVAISDAEPVAESASDDAAAASMEGERASGSAEADESASTRQAAPAPPAPEPPVQQPWEDTAHREPPRARVEHGRADRVHYAASEVRRPRIERVVLPSPAAPVGTVRPSGRQLGIALLLVTIVIAASIAFGVVLGRWMAQPVAGPAAGAPHTPTTTAPAPNRTPRPADSALIDAL